MICVPTVRDRLVQRVIYEHLERTKKLPIYNQCSFAYIKHKGPLEALNTALRLRRENTWVLKTDIQNFFDNIPREYVKERLRRILRASSLLPLLDAVVNAEPTIRVQDKGKAAANGFGPGRGIRQGMPLSPVLSNICLADFDKRVERRGIRMVRYSDDLAFFFSSENACREALKFVEDELRALGLSLPGIEEAGKTRIVPPDQPLYFLGREIVYLKRCDDYVVRIGGPQIRKIKATMRKDYCLARALANGVTLQKFVPALGETVGAYLGIYKAVFDYGRLEYELNKCAHEILRDMFVDLFGEDIVLKLPDRKRQFIGIPQIVLQPFESGAEI